MTTPLRHYAIIAVLMALAVFPVETNARNRSSASSSHYRHGTQPSITASDRIPVVRSSGFIENRGQWDGPAKFLLRTAGLDTWITDHGLVYDLYRISRVNSPLNRVLPQPADLLNMVDSVGNISRTGHVVTFTFEKPSSASTVRGIDRQQGYYNYFIGDQSRHASEVALYDRSAIRNLYNGIDAVFYLDRGMPRYDLLVAPGADPRQIQIKVAGAQHVEVTPTGALSITTTMGRLEQHGLYAYQQIAGTQRQVACRFVVEQGREVRFELGTYDQSRPLVIDPLIYSTFIGGSGNEAPGAIAIDSSGNAYVTGYAYSPAYPVTEGAYDQSFNGGTYDLFVSKLDSTGSNLIYSTFIGGSGMDAGMSIAVDTRGNAYVAGFSDNGPSLYPVTQGAYDVSIDGFNDGVVTKLNSTGTAILYSTYIGGGLRDGIYDIALDSINNLYLVGVTGGTGSSPIPFPTTPGAFDTSLDGLFDYFVAKLDSNGSELLYSTLIGGNNIETGMGIAADARGNTYITGHTFSSDYPTTIQAFDKSQNGLYDIFVTKLNSSGSELLYSTFIGGDSSDYGYGIAIDSENNAYVTGYTRSNTYPTTPGAYDQIFNGVFDAIVTKLNSSGSELLYSTFIGGDSSDYGYGIAVDLHANAYLTGVTTGASVPFPTTSGSFDESHNGLTDGIIARLDSSGSTLLYSTFIGGSIADAGYGIAIDAMNDVYVTGNSSGGTPMFPTTTEAFDTTFNGGAWDVYVVKFDVGAHPPLPPEPTDSCINVITPNPADDMVQVTYGLPEGAPVTIEIFSVDGKLLGSPLKSALRGAGNHSEIISVAGLFPGAYSVRLTTSTTSCIHRFVIVR